MNEIKLLIELFKTIIANTSPPDTCKMKKITNAEANLVRNEITNYLVDLSTIQEQRKDLQQYYMKVMNELEMQEDKIVKTLVRGSK